MSGAVLRKKREELGLELPQIAEHLRIRAEYLDSIEQDRFEKLPAPVYTMGYIRCYAQHLNVDPAEIIKLYSERLPKPKADIPSIPLVLAEKRRPVALYAVLTLIVAAAAIWLYLKMPQLTGARQTATVEAKHAIPPGRKPVLHPSKPATVSTATTEKQELQKAVTPAEQERPAAEDKKTAVQAAPVQTVTPAPPSPVRDVPAAGPVSGKNTHLLSIKATEASWVSVRFSNGNHDQATIKPGLSKEWGFSGKVAVRIGNAGGVTVTLDGKDIGPVGAPKQAVSLVLPQ
ncbi:MAG: DUF4115 domain-containing protein [Nitrospiraceae bacterium]|nr:DUF4115 domain-containing protein [Nitrospiraceae bacterium]